MYGYVPTQGHGREFMDIGNRISAKSGRFTITRLANAETMSNVELDSNVQARNQKMTASRHANATMVFVYNRDGAVELTVTKSQPLVRQIIERCQWKVDNNWTGSRAMPQKVVLSNDAALMQNVMACHMNKVMRK